VLLLALIVAPRVAHSQRATPAAVTGGRAFAAEAVGGAVGAALGIAVGLAIAKPNECAADDDVVCTLQRLSITGVVGVAGATIGTAVAGRLAGTRPSLAGALLGAVTGLAVGIGLEHLITEELNQSLGDAGAVVLFSVTQGILAAAGSRFVAQMSR
jgi:hypothetical protein